MQDESNKDLWGGTETKFFYEITPDKVLEAVESYGLECTGRSLALNSLENRVYDVEIEDGSFRVIKFYRPNRWSKAQILEEHQFISDLEEEEIPVVSPIPCPNGETLKTDQKTGSQ